MKVAALLVVVTLIASPALAQQQLPIHASVERAAEAAAQSAPRTGTTKTSGGKSGLFWSGLVVGIAGATTSALGLTVFRTEDSSTGNAPAGTYQACVAQKTSSPIYATNQCGALKAKNLAMLWGGVAVAGVGTVMMIGGSRTSAELTPGSIGLFHHLRF